MRKKKIEPWVLIENPTFGQYLGTYFTKFTVHQPSFDISFNSKVVLSPYAKIERVDAALSQAMFMRLKTRHQFIGEMFKFGRDGAEGHQTTPWVKAARYSAPFLLNIYSECYYNGSSCSANGIDISAFRYENGICFGINVDDNSSCFSQSFRSGPDNDYNDYVARLFFQTPGLSNWDVKADDANNLITICRSKNNKKK